MDKNEQLSLKSLPAHALSLNLARSPIRMRHANNWKINKLNPDHDLVICLTGSADYQIDNVKISLGPGDAMLIPAYRRFQGCLGKGAEIYTGIAQHFSLELFGRGDLINKMNLRSHIHLENWEMLEPLVKHYRDSNNGISTNLACHYQFMVLLLEYLDQALIGWHSEKSEIQSEDHISLQIMLVASRLSADVLSEEAVEELMATIPYNEDYFRRAFSDRIGVTPKKYREQKRMEFAVHRLGVGLSVKQVAAELGFIDPYYFSRLFKQYMGASPSKYRWKHTDPAKID